ncbi:MAG: diacylglycerol kinase family protein [Oscillospiraceae bacterium]|jgi:diacylglycerol kinase|nr:diacylglycerol kinase family protein [Oscillospiraceae bacterium]
MPFLRSFRFAFRGLRHCLRERNFRFHAALAAYMFGYLLIYDWFTLTRAEWAALALAAAAVLFSEAVNTALEALVDLASPETHPLAAKAKDVGAGAVLVCSIGAVAVGIAVLGQPEAFRALAAYYKAKPLMLLALAGSLTATGLWVFPDWGRKRHIKK